MDAWYSTEQYSSSEVEADWEGCLLPAVRTNNLTTLTTSRFLPEKVLVSVLFNILTTLTTSRFQSFYILYRLLSFGTLGA